MSACCTALATAEKPSVRQATVCKLPAAVEAMKECLGPFLGSVLGILLPRNVREPAGNYHLQPDHRQPEGGMTGSCRAARKEEVLNQRQEAQGSILRY